MRRLFTIQPFDSKKNPQLHPGPCTPRPMCRRDGPTEPFITRCFTIALCHRRDCWKSLEWMCGLWLLVIKRQGVAINIGVSFMLSSVWPVCPVGQNDKMTFLLKPIRWWMQRKTDQSYTDLAVFFELILHKLNSKMKRDLFLIQIMKNKTFNRLWCTVKCDRLWLTNAMITVFTLMLIKIFFTFSCD